MTPEASQPTAIQQDYSRLFPDAKPTIRRCITAAATHPGFLACLLLRTQQMAYSRGQRRLAEMLRVLTNSLTGADFLPGSKIGGGLVLHHPTGVVVGRGAEIGPNCTIMQNVTIGEKYADGSGSHSYPVIEQDVVVGAGAKILGGINIGMGARIAANAVVLRDVPRGALAAGLPASVKRYAEQPNQKAELTE